MIFQNKNCIQLGVNIFAVHMEPIDDPGGPVVYFDFETQEGLVNHGAEFVCEPLPFAPKVRFI